MILWMPKFYLTKRKYYSLGKYNANYVTCKLHINDRALIQGRPEGSERRVPFKNLCIAKDYYAGIHFHKFL